MAGWNSAIRVLYRWVVYRWVVMEKIDWRMPVRLRNMIDQYRQGWASCRR